MDERGILTLFFQRMKMFFDDPEGETEIGVGAFVAKDTVIKMKVVTETREYKIGDRIVFTADEFNDVGWGCWVFADDLGKKLRPLERRLFDRDMNYSLIWKGLGWTSMRQSP